MSISNKISKVIGTTIKAWPIGYKLLYYSLVYPYLKGATYVYGITCYVDFKRRLSMLCSKIYSLIQVFDGGIECIKFERNIYIYLVGQFMFRYHT